MLLSLASPLAGCEGSGEQEPDPNEDCEVACGDNGTCSSDGTFCACDFGFIDVGEGCEPVACSSDSECDNGDPCDGQEFCNTTQNTCAQGTAVICGGNRSCDSDSGACQCADGFVDVGNGCEEVSCESDADCDNGIACDGIDTCDTANNTCVSGEPVSCGDGASCAEPDAICTCDDGFVDVGDGCEPVACETDEDCDNGLYCDGVENCDTENNTCVRGKVVACDGGKECSNQSEECQCPFGTTDVGDGCEAVVCQNDGDCSDGNPCNGVETCNAGNNRCVKGTAVDCGELGSCVPEGDEATCNCDEGGVLDGGDCLAECPVPQAYTVDVIRDGDDITFSTEDELGVEFALVEPETPEDEIQWMVGNTATFSDVSGAVRVVSRVSDASCVATAYFSNVYDVRQSFAPAAEQEGSTAIPAGDERIVGWASGHSEVNYGEEVDERWRTPENAYGSAGGGSLGVVVLGRGGDITMTFDQDIVNGEGPDLAVFENGFSDAFLELGYVEVSSNGENFERFDVLYTGTIPVGGFGAMDPTVFTGFAGKYRSGFGTPFDLELLKNREAVRNGTVDLNVISHVKIVDVNGSGGADGYEAELDAQGCTIYDLYPTMGSAGFDLTGIAILNGSTE